MPLFTGFLNTSQVKLFGFFFHQEYLTGTFHEGSWISTYEVGSCSRVSLDIVFQPQRSKKKYDYDMVLFMFMYYIYIQYTYMITVLYFYKSIYISTFVGKVRVK